MPDEQLERADKLAQEVVNAWEVNVSAGNAAVLTGQFKALMDSACLYQDARSIANNRREYGMLSEQEKAEEEAARQAFVKTYESFCEKHAKRHFAAMLKNRRPE
jgi:hypothetical protein